MKDKRNNRDFRKHAVFAALFIIKITDNIYFIMQDTIYFSSTI